MDIIFGIFFELIVECSMGAVGDKKVAMPVRVLAALFLTLFFGGLVVVFVCIGISENEPVILFIGFVIALLVILAIFRTVKKHRISES